MFKSSSGLANDNDSTPPSHGQSLSPTLMDPLQTQAQESTTTQRQGASNDGSSDDSVRDVACMLMPSSSTDESVTPNIIDAEPVPESSKQVSILCLPSTSSVGKTSGNSTPLSSIGDPISPTGPCITSKQALSRDNADSVHFVVPDNTSSLKPQPSSFLGTFTSLNIEEESLDFAIEISSDDSPEIPLISLPPSLEPNVLNGQMSQPTSRARRGAYVLIPPLPRGSNTQDYSSNSSNSSTLDRIASNFSDLARRVALGLRPTIKRKAESPTTPPPRKRVHRASPLEDLSENYNFLGFCTEPVEGFSGSDPLDSYLDTQLIEIGEDVLYAADEEDRRGLRSSLMRSVTYRSRPEPSPQVAPPEDHTPIVGLTMFDDHRPFVDTTPFESNTPFDEPSSGPEIDYSTLLPWSVSVQHHETYGNGTIDPSVLGGGPMQPIEPSPPQSPSLPLQPLSPPPVIPTQPDDIPAPPQFSVSSSISYPPTTATSRSSSVSQKRHPKGRGRAKPSQELLAAVPSIKRRSATASSSSVRDRKPSTRIREALKQADYEISDEDADGETDNEDFEPITTIRSHQSSKESSASLTQNQPKPSRKSISTVKDSVASRKGFKEYCHQCRNKAKSVKMQCSCIKPDGSSCGLWFCERCVERRYPGLIRFDCEATDFVCPKCDNYCNCTACARQRGEEYISSRGTGPSPFLSTTQPQKPSHISVPPGMFWGTVYGIDGNRIGAGVASDDRSVIITTASLPSGNITFLPPIVAAPPTPISPVHISTPPPSLPDPAPTSRRRRKIIYAGKPPRAVQNRHPSSTPNGGTQKRIYIGDKRPLTDRQFYKSLEEHFAVFDIRSSSPLTPISENNDPTPPNNLELGFLIAQALHNIER